MHGVPMSAKELKGVFDANDAAALASAGIELGGVSRSATFIQQDNALLCAKSLAESVDIMSTAEALEKDPEARAHYGKAFEARGHDFPRDTEGGYFIRIKKGKKVELPIQACLFLKRQNFKQKVHNIIVVEEGAQAYLITGCAASKAAHEGLHLGISEFFIKKGGHLNFTMIHSWREDISVKPMSIALVDENATYVSNYICLKPVRDITMYPTAVLRGKGGRAIFNSLVLSHPETLQDVGSRVIFEAPDTQAQIIARAVSLGGKMVSRGHLQAKTPGVKAHLECRGLILSEKGTIQAVPELETDYRDVDMSHEAAIGRISKNEIEYLATRGMTQAEAQSVIIRGFMDVNILGLPEVLQREIEALEEKTLQATF